MKRSDIFNPALPPVHLGSRSGGDFRRRPATLSAGEESRNGIPALKMAALARDDVAAPRASPSLCGHNARHVIAPTAGGKCLRLRNPAPYLRAHPAVGSPYRGHILLAPNVLRDTTRPLACPEPGQHRHQPVDLSNPAPRPCPFRGVGRPATFQKSRRRRTDSGILSPNPCLIEIPPSSESLCRTRNAKLLRVCSPRMLAAANNVPRGGVGSRNPLQIGGQSSMPIDMLIDSPLLGV